MALIEVGRVCIKTKGRSAGKKCVIVGMDGSFALIDGDGMKKKKCNTTHLFPTQHTVNVSKNSSHEEIVKHLKGVKIDG